MSAYFQGDKGSQPLSSSIIKLLQGRSFSESDRPAYTFLRDGEGDEVAITYQELDRQARAIGAILQDAQLSGERVLLLYPPGLEYIVAFFGCLYAGVIAVPVYPPDPNRLTRTLPRLQAIAKDSGAKAALTISPILQIAQALFSEAPDLKALQWIATDDLKQGIETGWKDPGIGRETLAFLQYTSGSTGHPKGVMLTHGNLLHNQGLIKTAFGHDEKTIVMGWLPPYHDMGLIGIILQPLYLGVPCYLMSPISFLQEPIRWLKAMTRYKATTSGGPNFAYDLCVRKISPEQRETLDLSHWEVAFNGAEPVRAETIERFTEYFSPCGFRKEAFLPCYGLAEGTLVVSAGLKSFLPIIKKVQKKSLQEGSFINPPEEGEGIQPLVGCGHCLGDQRVLIVNPETLMPCRSGQIGEIWVRGPSVAGGYWNRSEETKEIFQNYVNGLGEGPFLRTGDLGFSDEGELFITGRLKDLIIIRGQNHYPQDIERTVEKSFSGLRLGCGAAFSVEVEGEERLVVVQEVERRFHERRKDRENIAPIREQRIEDRRKAPVEAGHDPEERQAFDLDQAVEAINAALTQEHELQVYAIVFLKAGTIPKTSSGKIQRYACKKGFLEGSFEAIGEWRREKKLQEEISQPSIKDRESIELWLVLQLAKKLGIDPLKIDRRQSITSYGLDSLAAIELSHAMESALNINLPMATLLGEVSVAQLAAQVLDHSTKASPTPLPTVVPSKQKVSEYPLSRGQKAIWFLHQVAPESGSYNIASAVRIRGDLNIQSLQQSFQKMMDRHAALRTTFCAPQGEPVQKIHETMPVFFQEEDASNWNETTLSSRLVQEAYLPFDLEQGPLLRIHLFRRAKDEQILLLSIHHIISDFRSLEILIQELGALYPALREGRTVSLPESQVQFADYVRWEEEVLKSQEMEQHWEYWQEELSGELPVLNLSTDRPRPAVQSYHGASQPFQINRKTTEKLKALSQENGCTFFMTLLAAFEVFLHRYTGQEDVLVGTATSGRNFSSLGNLVGYLINFVALRGDLSSDISFKDFLQQTRRTVLSALEHQDFPFPLLVERLQPERDPSRSPIYQVMLLLQTAHQLHDQGLSPFALGEELGRMKLDELTLESMAFKQRPVQMDLILMVAEGENGLMASLQYNSDLFEADTIRRMTNHFQTLMEGIAQNPDAKISSLPILNQEERQQILVGWNDTARDYPRDKCIHQLFEEQLERTPDKVAALFENQQLTYRELNARANQLAHHLKKLGVGPEVLVGIAMERSLDMVIGLLGILKAGGAYVPLDPSYPKERLAFILEDTEVPILLTQTGYLKDLSGQKAEIICLDGEWEKIEKESKDNLFCEVTPDHAAFILYTSGSTGVPKGVIGLHRAVAGRVSCDPFPLERGEVFCQKTSLNFIDSLWEIFAPLTHGLPAVIVPDEALKDPKRFIHLLGEQEVTRIVFVPSLLRLILDTDTDLPSQLPKLKYWISSGEELPAELVTRFSKRMPGSILINLYGTSETWDATWYDTQKGISPLHVPIGYPLSNVQVYILDAYQQPVPIGVAGELHVGGFELARGYLNRPELTQEKFIKNPFSGEPGSLLYRTGDLARYLSDGKVELLGRRDHQVKIRGFRIELGEIEKAIMRYSTVKETAVTLREDHPGDRKIVAYLVPELNHQVSEKGALEKDRELEQVSQWKAVWEETYSKGSEQQKATFNISGFNSSYTNLPIAAKEVEEWVDGAVNRVLSLNPQRVLEIGCGAGLLLHRIAPHCAQYWGTDFSQTALNSIRQHLNRPGLSQVTLFHRMADDFEKIEAGSFDAVVLNSVLQYFPGVDYLLRVLEGAVKAVRPGGFVFIGDVRDLRLLESFHTTVQLYQASPHLPIAKLKERVQRQLAREKELVLDPIFFKALKNHLPAITHVQIQPKRGRLPNEFTKFRYDVMLHVGSQVRVTEPVSWMNWQKEDLSLPVLRRLIEEDSREILAIEGIPNGRIVAEVEMEKWIQGANGHGTVSDLKKILENSAASGVDPEDLWALNNGISYGVDLHWSEPDEYPNFKVVLKRRRATETGSKELQMFFPPGNVPTRPWRAYANNPLQGQLISSLIPEVQKSLQVNLPEYMIPSSFVILENLPMTPSGKLDRRALPSPDQVRPELEQAYLPPRNSAEEFLAQIFSQVLGFERVGINDNFFSLGGHSLLATQVMSRVEKTFHLEIPLHHFFEAPTVAGFAEILIHHEKAPGQIAAIARLRKKINQMSHEEIRALLKEEKKGGEAKAYGS